MQSDNNSNLQHEAVSCAVYLLNRLLIPNRHNIIPYCKRNDSDPTTLGLTHLRTFGCLAYTTLPPTQRDGKFAPTAITAVMVGYDSNRKAYRLYHPESQTVYTSNQVRFDEQRYPLLDSPITDLSHKFATSTLGGVPVIQRMVPVLHFLEVMFLPLVEPVFLLICMQMSQIMVDLK